MRKLFTFLGQKLGGSFKSVAILQEMPDSPTPTSKMPTLCLQPFRKSRSRLLTGLFMVLMGVVQDSNLFNSYKFKKESIEFMQAGHM